MGVETGESKEEFDGLSDGNFTLAMMLEVLKL
jgi:hypothetical protein